MKIDREDFLRLHCIKYEPIDDKHFVIWLRNIPDIPGLEDKENMQQLASYIEADYQFNPSFSRTDEGVFLFNLDIHELTNGDAVFRTSRNSDVLGIDTTRSEEIALFLYNEIYNVLKMGIINNYGKL